MIVLGGVVYHNLGLEFRSPTINLYFTKDDFVVFVKNLKGFLDAELIELDDKTKEFPVGKLEYNGAIILVYFLHYKSFNEAKEKWNERKKRVDFSNIYIIWTVPYATEEDIKNFNALPYKNKMFITSKNITNDENVKTSDVFEKKNYRAGDILAYKTIYSLKKNMDDIDYVSFLNIHN